jgi:flagellar basal-body rod modification protein FlgD
MTYPIDTSSGGFTPISAPGQPTAGNEVADRTQLDKDAFLKLLVAQLRYQDPSKPADSSAFLAQTAQFAMVEKLTDLASGQAELLTAQLMLGASNLVGRTVTYTGFDGLPVTGVVDSATFGGSSPTLRVGHMDVPLSSVTDVRSTGTIPA